MATKKEKATEKVKDDDLLMAVEPKSKSVANALKSGPQPPFVGDARLPYTTKESYERGVLSSHTPPKEAFEKGLSADSRFFLSNAINSGGFTLTPTEWNVLLVIAQSADHQVLNQYQVYWAGVNDLVDSKMNRTGAYTGLKIAADNLFDREIHFESKPDAKGDSSEIRIRLVQRAVYKKGRGIIGVKFTEDFCNLWNAMDGHTRIVFNQVRNLRKPYAIRLYLLLSAFLNKGSVQMKIKTLRQRMDCKDKLKRYCDFKKVVITPSVAIINSNPTSEFFVQFDDQTGRTGRSVDMVRFILTPRPKAVEVAPVEPKSAAAVTEPYEYLTWEQARLPVREAQKYAFALPATESFTTHREELLRVITTYSGRNMTNATEIEIVKELCEVLRNPRCVRQLWNPFLKEAGLYPNGSKRQRAAKIVPSHYMRITAGYDDDQGDLFRALSSEEAEPEPNNSGIPGPDSDLLYRTADDGEIDDGPEVEDVSYREVVREHRPAAASAADVPAQSDSPKKPA